MQDKNLHTYIKNVVENMPADWLNLTTHRLDIYVEKLAKTQFLEQFEDFNFHIIINTHSNLMLSDIPKENVIVLDRKDNKTSIKNITSQTLAQNLFENLNNDFFLDKFIGGYIEDKIKNILKKDYITANEKELISNLGEKILRVSLEMKYDIDRVNNDKD